MIKRTGDSKRQQSRDQRRLFWEFISRLRSFVFSPALRLGCLPNSVALLRRNFCGRKLRGQQKIPDPGRCATGASRGSPVRIFLFILIPVSSSFSFFFPVPLFTRVSRLFVLSFAFSAVPHLTDGALRRNVLAKPK